MGSLWSREPTMLLAVVSAGLALIMGFGVNITKEQMSLVMTFVAAVLGLINRSQVTSPDTLQNMTPQTLKTAQDSTQPVKDTVRKLPIWLLACVLASGMACASHQVGATPKASAALKADAVVIRINELQAATIQACGAGPTCQPNSLSTALARDIVQTAIDIRSTAKAVPAGWQATVRAAWTQARPRFRTVTNPAILAALAGVDALLGGL